MHPAVVCHNPDGTVSALICERQESELHTRFLKLLEDIQAVEAPEFRYDEMGISYRVHRVGSHRLESGWSYAEFSIRGPVELVERIVAELRRTCAKPGTPADQPRE